VLDSEVIALVWSWGVLSLVSPGVPLRLKRRELKEHVLCRARKLAESGRFEGWQGFEFELRFFEGFPKARTWLIGPIRRDEPLIGQSDRRKVGEARKAALSGSLNAISPEAIFSSDAVCTYLLQVAVLGRTRTCIIQYQ